MVRKSVCVCVVCMCVGVVGITIQWQESSSKEHGVGRVRFGRTSNPEKSEFRRKG